MKWNIVLMAFCHAILNISATSFLKVGLKTKSINNISSLIAYGLQPIVWAGLTFLVLGLLLMLKMIALYNLSVVIPIVISFSFFLTVLVSVIFFQETLDLKNILGMLFIIGGVFIIGYRN